MGQASIKKSGSNIHLELATATFDNFCTATLEVSTTQRNLLYKCTPTMPATVPCFEVLVQADPDNVANVFVGGPGGCYFQLGAGGTLTMPINDVGKVYARSAAGTQRVNWIAMV